MAAEPADAGAVAARRILRGEPARLAQEIAETQASIRSLSLTNYAVHIENHKTERATREQLVAGGETVARIEATAAAAAARLEDLQPRLARLHGAHAKLRQTLLHHSAVVELLEAPSVMESCLRAGLFDEALDVAEYGSNLFFAHRLWLPAPPAAPDAAPPPQSIVARVVAEIRVVADDLRESILRQLSGRVALPLVLRLLGHLRRLYTQQALARKRVAELQLQLQQRLREQKQRQPHDGGGGGGGATAGLAERLTPSAAMFALSAAEDCAIVETLRLEFLAARDAWHRAELDSIPRHSAHQYLLRIVDAQRTQWADVATQFLAVCHTVRPLQPQVRAGGGISFFTYASFSFVPPLTPSPSVSTPRRRGATLGQRQRRRGTPPTQAGAPTPARTRPPRRTPPSPSGCRAARRGSCAPSPAPSPRSTTGRTSPSSSRCACWRGGAPAPIPS